MQGHGLLLPGPTGEANRIELRPRGRIACVANSVAGLMAQAIVSAATGNVPVFADTAPAQSVRESLGAYPCAVVPDPLREPVDAVLADLPPAEIMALRQRVAARPGPIVPVIVPVSEMHYSAWRLFTERAICINTAAAGGNAALMTLDESQ